MYEAAVFVSHEQDDHIILDQLQKQLPPPMEHLHSDMPLGVVELIKECLTGDPDQRPSVGAIADRLRELKQQLLQLRWQ